MSSSLSKSIGSFSAKGALYTALLTAFAATLLAGSARAADATKIILTIKDHKLVPAQITAPHGERLELVVTNAGPGPEEIESKSLRIEKLIPEGQTVTLRVGPLKASTYDLFGDFNAATCTTTLTVQ